MIAIGGAIDPARGAVILTASLSLTRAHARHRDRRCRAANFSFSHNSLSYGVGWRWWPAAPIALPGVLLSLAWRIETGGIGGGDGRSDLVHPLRTAGGVGLRRVLMCSPMAGGGWRLTDFKMAVRP